MSKSSNVEMAFYAKPGPYQGMPSMRLPPGDPMPSLGYGAALCFGMKRVHPRMEVTIATELDLAELLVGEQVFCRAAPLIERLRLRTLSRRRYDQLVAIMTENAMVTGQVDETKLVLGAIERQWRRCPAAYIPDLFAPVRRLFAHINPAAWRK